MLLEVIYVTAEQNPRERNSGWLSGEDVQQSGEEKLDPMDRGEVPGDFDKRYSLVRGAIFPLIIEAYFKGYLNRINKRSERSDKDLES
jgi:hypothetical protein